MDSFFAGDDVPVALAGFLERFYGDFPSPKANLEEVLTYLHLCEARDEVWTEWPHGEHLSYAELLGISEKKAVTHQ